MPIDGFGLAGYRSFGDEPQFIGPFRKVNLFIGQNNAGKSNILTFLTKHYARAVKATREASSSLTFEPVDRHIASQQGQLQIIFTFSIDGHALNKLAEQHGHGHYQDRLFQPALSKLLKSDVLTRGTAFLWLPFAARWTENAQSLALSTAFISTFNTEHVLTDAEWQSVWGGLTDQGGGSPEHHWIPQTIQHLTGYIPDSPKVTPISAIRQVVKSQSLEVNDHSGLGLIDRLAKLQNPSHDSQSLRDDFKKINAFLQAVTGNPSATLEIPHDRDTIVVHMDRKALPLSSLGTGIHEVVILAAAATVLRDQVVCIEEPEIHLHPTLQRKLLKYLQEQTDNQYFIATHSAHLLDTPNVAIFHVRLEDGCSVVEPVSTAGDKSRVCADLGYRASDLLQANYIVWVEGPSDRIYLNHWIHAVDPDLIEGIHYSIMFYGGRLLCHLTADDPDVKDFISLRRLNRHISILMDSDRGDSAADINQTKQRMQTEFETSTGFAWVTMGREIENYIPHSLLELGSVDTFT